jgi:hypothetical protein
MLVFPVCGYDERWGASKHVAVLTIYKTLFIYRLFATAVSKIKICDFSGENFKCFEVL